VASKVFKKGSRASVKLSSHVIGTNRKWENRKREAIDSSYEEDVDGMEMES